MICSIFLLYTAKHGPLKRIKDQFTKLDKNGNGVITMKEMREAFAAAGQDYSLKDVQTLIKQADSNNDGKVSEDIDDDDGDY